MRRAKAYAALRGMKLRDLVAEGIETRLKTPANPAPREFPVFEKASRSGANTIPNRTNAEIEAELGDF